ncbi:hypothetical protein PAPYR_12993 [Paratrimastix pyriformis]|uniref:Uncharacterized protein n=1 Tax=Paratrimastix pyriformis TaxID=342808 RepID=A0ABQ8U2K0_9EUKA|nr:hypothetical protein PAPYR_12993 [Paratrimastix pyriformis]
MEPESFPAFSLGLRVGNSCLFWSVPWFIQNCVFSFWWHLQEFFLLLLNTVKVNVCRTSAGCLSRSACDPEIVQGIFQLAQKLVRQFLATRSCQSDFRDDLHSPRRASSNTPLSEVFLFGDACKTNWDSLRLNRAVSLRLSRRPIWVKLHLSRRPIWVTRRLNRRPIWVAACPDDPSGSSDACAGSTCVPPWASRTSKWLFSQGWVSSSQTPLGHTSPPARPSHGYAGCYP